MVTQEQIKELSKFDTHTLTSFLRQERNTAFILWQTDDVILKAEEMGFEMSEDTAIWIIAQMDRRSDCELGITWFTVEHYIQDWIDENTFQVTIREISTGHERVTDFCAIETNEKIEEYWNDDNYYFYGISKEELKNYEGKEFPDGDCIIVKVE